MSGDDDGLNYQTPPVKHPDVEDQNATMMGMILKLQRELEDAKKQHAPPVVVPATLPPMPPIAEPAPPTASPKISLQKISRPHLQVILKRLVVVILVIAIVTPFVVPWIGNAIVDRWIKPTSFNITDPTQLSRSEVIAYDFVARHGKVPAATFLSRIRGINKNPKLYQIQTADDLLQVFDRNQTMVKAMIEILRTTGAKSVSSFHVVDEVAAFDSLPDLLIMDNKYEAPEKWSQYLLTWMRERQRSNGESNQALEWALWIAGIFGLKSAETRNLDRYTFLFGPKIVGTGTSTTTVAQKIPLYDAVVNRAATRNFHNMIFVDGIVPFIADSPPGFKLEKCTGLKYTGPQAWEIQAHLETSKVLLNVTN